MFQIDNVLNVQEGNFLRAKIFWSFLLIQPAN
jgi:hypothetical protein